MKVYTWVNQPFRCGGTGEFVATEVEEYTRFFLTNSYTAILVENPVKKLHHVFLEECGALIVTLPDREEAMKMVQEDASAGDVALMAKQIAQGIRDRDGARVVPMLEFFGKFQGERREA